MKKERQLKETIVVLWKKKNIDRIEFEFYAGGDSMGDTYIYIYNKKGKNVKNEEIENFFYEEVYDRVEFYVNSDGHYQGESGIVTITLDDDDDFNYSKDSKSQYREDVEREVLIPLIEEEEAFINTNMLNCVGDDGQTVINFKRDFILSNDDEILVSQLEKKIENTIVAFEPVTEEGDLEEFYSFNTANDDNSLEIRDKNLVVNVNYSVTVYKQE
jgi:hypothetical protein